MAVAGQTRQNQGDSAGMPPNEDRSTTVLVTRYQTAGGHGWYVGSHAGIVLAVHEVEIWPGVFEAYCRLRGRQFEDLRFRSGNEEAEFLRDVHTVRPGSSPETSTTSP